MSDSVPDTSELAALERFVVENDELLELEECIGRFNIFDAPRVVDVEIRHSNFLAWLLDPAESHGQGGLFLRAILMDVLRTARENGFACPMSPVDLDGEDLSGVEVRREWRNIDLLITGRDPSFVVAIENKVKSGESKGQLLRYLKVLADDDALSTRPRLCVFLTVEGDDPSDENWLPYSYGDVHRVLRRVRNANEASIGDDVGVMLDHYLRVIQGRLMEDPRIDELCEKIYKNHRRAIDLIFDRIGTPSARIVSSIEEHLRQDDHWRVTKRTSKVVDFVPLTWDRLLPPIGKKPDSQLWIVVRFDVQRKGCYSGIVVLPTRNADLRSRVIDRLIRDKQEFGLGTFFKDPRHISERWTKLGRKRIASWSAEEDPEEEVVMKSVGKQLDNWRERLAGVPQALRPIVEQWEHERHRASG